MKKFNKNIIVFVLAFLFVGFGFSINSVKSLVYRCGKFLISDLRKEGFHAFETFTADMDRSSSEYLQYHDELMDLDSLKHFFLNTRLIQKEDAFVVKTDDNTLTESCARCSDDCLETSASAIQSLQLTAEEAGADFLYIAAPTKNTVYSTPENIENFSADNYDRYIKALQQKGVPTLDLYDELRKENMLDVDTYFRTDHHWTPETGFWATEKICSTLSDHYGFEYDDYYTDLENYTTKTYPDWFLGSSGKKVGRYFTAGGPDDITLITPKFETNFTELQPLKEWERTGRFEETVLDMEHIQTKDHYGLSPYSTYGGGDFRQQIIKNHLNPDGAKILIVRDSFACAVTPFLALNASELHIIDVRDFIPADPIDVYEYVREISPDYVLVLYSGTEFPDQTSGKFAFSPND
jgi:hypothetical protein